MRYIPHTQDFVWAFIISYCCYCNLLLPGLCNKSVVSSHSVQCAAAAMGKDSYLPSMVKIAGLQRHKRISFSSIDIWPALNFLLVLGCLLVLFLSCFFCCLIGWLVFITDFQDIWKVLYSSQRIMCQLRITFITLILTIESGIMIAAFLLHRHFHLSDFALLPFYTSTTLWWHSLQFKYLHFSVLCTQATELYSLLMYFTRHEIKLIKCLQIIC